MKLWLTSILVLNSVIGCVYLKYQILNPITKCISMNADPFAIKFALQKITYKDLLEKINVEEENSINYICYRAADDGYMEQLYLTIVDSYEKESESLRDKLSSYKLSIINSLNIENLENKEKLELINNIRITIGIEEDIQKINTLKNIKLINNYTRPYYKNMPLYLLLIYLIFLISQTILFKMHNDDQIFID